MSDHYTELRNEELKNIAQLELYFNEKLKKHNKEIGYAKAELKDLDRKKKKIQSELAAHRGR